MTGHEPHRDNLPLYAVGALPREESEVLERHLAECSSCREELRSLNEAAAQIAMAVESAAPSAPLREQLLKRFEVEKAELLAHPVRERLDRGSRAWHAWFWAPAFASAILVIALAALWRHDRRFVQKNRELAARLEANDDVVRRARDLINTLSAEDTQQVTLVAAEAKPRPEAKALYSTRQRSLVLLAGNLNPLPAHKVYELWLLPTVGAQPVPAGTFKPDAHGSAALVLSQFGGGASAKGFAVTIEDEPGSSVPTMPIVLSGTT